jgi:DeoR family fructose operon transcriptional repressor
MSDNERDFGGTERLDAIIHFLRRQTSATLGEIAERFGVSEMTVRRDVEKLAKTGDVIRIPGGARLARSVTFEKSFTERLAKMAEVKEQIGRTAASLVKDGSAIVLDSGTTTLYIARHLRHRKNVIVITFSIAAMEELAGADSVRVELTGGVYRHSSHDLVGSGVSEGLARVYGQQVFIGAAALSLTHGVMVFDAEMPKALLKAAAKRILVIDSSKIGMEALYNYATLDDFDQIVTDRGIRPEHLEVLQQRCEVTIAE